MDSHHKKYLVVKSVIHKLITLALSSCSELMDDSKFYVVEAVKVLYNLASFDRVRYYIPGETASVSQRRKKFSAWGGMIGLYYLNQHSTLTDVKEFFENSSMKDIQVADLVLVRDTVKKLAIEQESHKSDNVHSSSLKENEMKPNEVEKKEEAKQEEPEQEIMIEKTNTDPIHRNKDFSE